MLKKFCLENLFERPIISWANKLNERSNFRMGQKKLAFHVNSSWCGIFDNEYPESKHKILLPSLIILFTPTISYIVWLWLSFLPLASGCCVFFLVFWTKIHFSTNIVQHLMTMTILDYAFVDDWCIWWCMCNNTKLKNTLNTELENKNPSLTILFRAVVDDTCHASHMKRILKTCISVLGIE